MSLEVMFPIILGIVLISIIVTHYSLTIIDINKKYEKEVILIKRKLKTTKVDERYKNKLKLNSMHKKD